MLRKVLLDNIKATGPIPFARYMQACLNFPRDGYYMRNSPISGDFITSPEISQVFGELCGIWFVSRWLSAGKPPSIRLIELGPGKGTLASDLVRILRKFTPNDTLKSVELVETSPTLRKLQQQALGGGLDVRWHDSLAQVGQSNSKENTYDMLIAHEFFDALPIHILQRKQAGWFEVMVNSTPDGEELALGLPKEPSLAASLLSSTSPRFKDIPVDAQLEISPASFSTAQTIRRTFSERGGAALIIDYGQDGYSSDSFRAFKNHKMVSVFETPGECDITADVDFAYLREALLLSGGDEKKVYVPPLITQAQFLAGMGFHERMKQLPADLAESTRRLIDPNGMGSQYKVMGIVASGAGGDVSRETIWPFDFNA